MALEPAEDLLNEGQRDLFRVQFGERCWFGFRGEAREHERTQRHRRLRSRVDRGQMITHRPSDRILVFGPLGEDPKGTSFEGGGLGKRDRTLRFWIDREQLVAAEPMPRERGQK